MEKNKKKKINPLNLCLSVILALLAVVMIFLALRRTVKNDRTDIPKKEFTEISTSSEEDDELLAVDEIDVDKLTANAAYISLYRSQMGSGVLAWSDWQNQYGGEAENLRGIYESLFNSDGLQIASAKSVKAQGNKEMLAALREMLSDFYSMTGLRTVTIEKAYAEAEPFVMGYYDYYGNYVEPDNAPECNEHESGYAVDFGLYFRETDTFADFDGSGDYEWFAKYAYRYGFVLRYPEDKTDITGMDYNPAHFRYVGREAAAVMHTQDLCFEEFQTYIKDFDFYNPLIVQTTEGCRVMYYVPDSGYGTTSAAVARRYGGELCPYSVSGNNSDGYIITLTPTSDFAVTETDSAADSDSSASESEF